MIMTLISVVLFLALVAVSVLGGRLARLLPEEQLSADSKDAVKLAMGLVATMTAVLLGLLITSAKSTYDTAQSEVMQMAAKISLLDRVLALYGPEAADARHALRDATADGIRRAGADAGALERGARHEGIVRLAVEEERASAGGSVELLADRQPPLRERLRVEVGRADDPRAARMSSEVTGHVELHQALREQIREPARGVDHHQHDDDAGEADQMRRETQRDEAGANELVRTTR